MNWDIFVGQIAAATERAFYDKVCPPRQAEALRLREAGLDPRAIATQMGTTPVGAKLLLDRADHRMAVVTKAMEGMDPREIAREFDVSYQGIVCMLQMAKESGYV